MSDSETKSEPLARLVESAAHQGADMGTVEAIIARAAEEGASRALARCGLHDDQAGADIRELRSLLDAWRDTKRTARRTLIHWIFYFLLVAILAGLAVRLKLFG